MKNLVDQVEHEATQRHKLEMLLRQKKERKYQVQTPQELAKVSAEGHKGKQ